MRSSIAFVTSTDEARRVRMSSETYMSVSKCNAFPMISSCSTHCGQKQRNSPMASALDRAEVAERGGVGNIPGGEFAQDDALLDQQDPVGQSLDEVDILLHEKNGQTAPAAQQFQKVDDLLDDRWLDALRRLVE